MARSDNEARAEFMARHGLQHANWNEDGELIAATRFTAPVVRPPPQQQPPAGPAAKLAHAFTERLKRDHETRFAASHFKPRLDVPEVTDNVPRAVRDREVARGGTSSKQRRRS